MSEAEIVKISEAVQNAEKERWFADRLEHMEREQYKMFDSLNERIRELELKYTGRHEKGCTPPPEAVVPLGY